MTDNQPICLLSGSMAYDTIMLFGDTFHNHILADKLHLLNVSFMVSDMRFEFGGCAGNIAYNLKLLGGNPRISAGLGIDGQRYIDHLKQQGIDVSSLVTYEDTYTAQAFITTDAADNQITVFHPGAMSYCVPPLLTEGVGLGLVGPAAKDTMVQHMQQLHQQGIPCMFDLGQAMPLFDGDELKVLIDQASYLAANDYEAEVIARRTGLSFEQIAKQLRAFVITHGSDGSTIYTQDTLYSIAVVEVDDALDPTGCGDAYRAGLLYGISNDLDWQTTGQLASLLGAIKIRCHGTQNHSFSLESLEDDYLRAFGKKLDIAK